MLAPTKVLLHQHQILRGVGIASSHVLQYVDLDLCLFGVLLTVAHHLDCHFFLFLVVDALKDLPKRSFAEHTRDFVTVGDVSLLLP